MIGFSSRSVGRHYKQLCDVETACTITDRRVSEAASLLVLAHSGLRLDSATIEQMAHRVAEAAEELGLEPEAMQLALCAQEPTLGLGE